jgi:hypothetical protein
MINVISMSCSPFEQDCRVEVAKCRIVSFGGIADGRSTWGEDMDCKLLAQASQYLALCRVVSSSRSTRSFTRLTCVAALIGAPAAHSAAIFSDDFSTQQPGWSFTSPSQGFLGELNNNVNVSAVTLDITVPTATKANISFDLLGFRALDGVNCCTDTLTFSTNGSVALTGAFSHNPAINQLLTNPSNATVTQLWVNTPPPGVGDANSGHRFVVPNVQLNAGVNTLTWSYSPLQDFSDEAWGLDNVLVTSKTWTQSCIDHLTDAVIHIAHGTKMSASFVPHTGATLAQAAADCELRDFNWQQTINITPNPSGFLFASGDPLIAPPKVPDPPPGGYDTRERLVTCSDGRTGSVITVNGEDSFPFYYGLNELRIAKGDGVRLDFRDTPTALCNSGQPWTGPSTSGEYHEYTTTLVGVDDNLNPVTLPVVNTWDWVSTFNGTSGGTYAPKNLLDADIGSGTGETAILSINGVPFTAVPEPPTLALIGLVFLLSLTTNRRARDKL